MSDPDGFLPMCPPPTDEERAASYRAIQRMHPANRFRLMFGQPLLPEPSEACGNEPEEKEESHG